MAHYMITWSFPPDSRNEAIHRFSEGSAMNPPKGVTHLGRWHAAQGGLGWGVVEAKDPKDIAKWLIQWSDVIEYDITPVLSDEELGEVVQSMG
jgi:Domain of unknown function (DUF3303)